ncbi:MAG: blue light receptor [Bathelium mastoideum]|nr:MAG: blue light receptor [Bathelium mastoideum]
MNGYYGQQYPDDLQGMGRGADGSNNMSLMGQGEMSPSASSGMLGGQSLDDIVNQNSKEMRRSSVPVHYGGGQSNMSPDIRRLSMMEFNGQSSGGALDTYQFDPATTVPDNLMSGQTPNSNNRALNSRNPSTSNVALNDQFAGQSSPYMQNPASAYQSPMGASSGIDVGMTDSFMSPNIPVQSEYSNVNSIMSGGISAMDMYSDSFASPMGISPVPQKQAGSTQTTLPADPSSGGATSTPRDQRTSTDHRNTTEIGHNSSRSQSYDQRQGTSTHQGTPQHPSQSQTSSQILANQAHFQHASSRQNPQTANVASSGKFPWADPPEGWPSTMHGRPHMNSQYKNAYSSTGFDMLGVLMRVATRPHPEINIGSVDLSCAFVVCDAEMDDFPIVYCSDNFERLTGYNKHMILGRNCRFLQSPDGNVQPGLKRKYVDDDSVLYLKNMINLRKEAQISLINYRRGGQPFMNLLTMIPIAWDTDNVKFFVGFQVDLVEQPNAVTNKNPDGSYSINYQRSMGLPTYTLNAPDHHSQTDLGGQTIPRDDVSTVLSTIGSGESELSKRIWDKVLLENTDDVIHVLSLKGLFLYLSPSSRRILEYEAHELVGTALSSVCHPSDIVPVTRELKDTSSGAAVNVVFRIRRKHSGYMWFEGHGSLHTEQGKGRKCIILVGRERPVYTLNKSDILAAGGIGENELWTKMSTSGMFLFVSGNVRQLLDRQPDELLGTSIQSLMRQDSKAEFGRILELCRTGKKASVRHEMLNKRGQVLQSFTTLYPGDASEGQKPTFVVAQTRLIKFSRGNQTSQRPPLYPKDTRESSTSVQTASSANMIGANLITHQREGTPKSTLSHRYLGTEGAAATYAGQNGLVLGHQDVALASEENVFDELKTTRSTSWQFELRQMEKRNRMLAEEVQSLLAAKKKRKRRKGAGQLQKDCANCHTRVTPEWRRGPSGNRDLCNSCGLRWAKLNGRVSPRTNSQHSVHSKSDGQSGSPSNAANQQATAKSVIGSKNESPNHTSTTPSTHIPSQSPRHAMADAHAAKVPKVESQASPILGGSSGIPPKIEEGIEPDT